VASVNRDVNDSTYRVTLVLRNGKQLFLSLVTHLNEITILLGIGQTISRFSYFSYCFFAMGKHNLLENGPFLPGGLLLSA